MVFSYDLTTNIGKVRLLISDSDVTAFHFTNEEITAFLTMASGSILTAAGYALEAWAAAITDSLKSEKIGDYAYTMDDAGKKLQLAKEYKEQDATKPYLTWSEMDLVETPDDVEMGE